MNILLIEDSAMFGKPIRDFLSAQGHTVTWIVGAQRVDRSKVIGILPSPDAAPLYDSWDGDPSRLVELEPQGLDLALVDGGLVGPVHSGSLIVPSLAANGVVCVAISGGGAGNPPLIAAGAQLGLPKEHVVLALRSGMLNPRETVEHPEKVAARLPAYVEQLRAEAYLAMKAGGHPDYGIPLDGLTE